MKKMLVIGCLLTTGFARIEAATFEAAQKEASETFASGMNTEVASKWKGGATLRPIGPVQAKVSGAVELPSGQLAWTRLYMRALLEGQPLKQDGAEIRQLTIQDEKTTAHDFMTVNKTLRKPGIKPFGRVREEKVLLMKLQIGKDLVTRITTYVTDTTGAHLYSAEMQESVFNKPKITKMSVNDVATMKAYLEYRAFWIENGHRAQPKDVDVEISIP